PRSGSRVRVSFPAPVSSTKPRSAGVLFFPEVRSTLRRLRKASPAWWQSGHAAACKAVYAGSIPTQASNQRTAGLVLAVARFSGPFWLLLVLVGHAAGIRCRAVA